MINKHWTVWDICKDWTKEERFKLYKDVSKLGFDAVIRNKSVKKLAHEILLLSENGLKKEIKPMPTILRKTNVNFCRLYFQV